MIKVQNLSYSYSSSGPKVLDNVSCDLEKGRCIAILGNNGAGKSTLLKCLNHIQKPQSGSVLLDDSNVYEMPPKEMAKKIGYVPQKSEVSHMMVFDAVLLGRKPYIRWDVTEKDRNIVEKVMKQLNLTEYATRYISELSGGELQKVVLARALAQEPQYLLLDEPTSNLDPRNQHDMLRLIRSICQEQKIGAIVVIHDLNLAVRYCDRFLFLRDASIYGYGGKEIVTEEIIESVYGMKVEILEHRGNQLIVPL
jgi:iron complex transport system ATP-binding protein